MALSENRATFTFNYSDQVDEWGAAEGDYTVVQSKMDSRAEENLADINNIKTTLKSETAGDSGAHNIKSAGITGLLSGTAATVYAMLDGLKAYIDTVASNFQLGALLNDSVTEAKMAAAMKKQSGGVAPYDTVNTHILNNAIDAHATIPSCMVYHDAAQSIANNTNTALAFNSERKDTHNMHDNATNNSRITCTVAGEYDIDASIAFASGGTGNREVYFRVNGNVYIAAFAIPSSTTTNKYITLSKRYVFAVNDYVECVVNQTDGGALNVLASNNTSAKYNCEFGMVKVG